ncbi:uncharacterized protein ACA1_173230 [Acanthamoeba castellanii str. Neff]|uniref:DNA/RNA-binding domain-containing protein n=1 Tax=Acanthamoeba castellanii (strain ATCC 30010 / Neff) TaxID=1257118 RepID=L8HHP4_ACACF|nr:uncharacterized protein ACA1_173230 [Acanthamoeba castellanii str. Neff]ELR24695.1 hypothetical protein ACA1_173230 [Acanthamoeba castellanii str. Neff]
MEEGVDVVAACFAEAWEAEAHLRSLLRSSGAALLPPSPALDAARHRLREACRQLLLTDVAFGVEKDVDQTTWKLGHYRLIEHPAEAKAASESLGSFLAESSRFYAALLQVNHLPPPRPREVSDRYAVVLDGSLTYARDGAVPGDGVLQTSSHPAYLACHRCLVILGDLARYRKDAANSPGWATEAVNHYKRAVRIWADNGNAHNQLAVVATHNGDDLEAAYRYARAINTPLPFPTARDNLAVLYQKIRQSPIDPTPPTLPASALLPKFLLLQASIGCPSVAPERFDELWEAYLRQAATVELGTAPLTDRVLYCMMTISTFSVGDLLGRQTDNAEAFEQALELMLHLAETLLAAAAAVTPDTRGSFELLPAVGHFLGWAAAHLHPPSLLAARLSARDRLCDSLLRLAKARNNSASAGKRAWPGHWEDEELRSAFALGMEQTEQHTSMQVALAALRLHQSLRPHLTEHQEEPPGATPGPAVQQPQPPRVDDSAAGQAPPAPTAAQGRESSHRSPTAPPAPRAAEPPRPEPAARDPAPAPAPVKPMAVEQQEQREGRPAEAGVKRKPIADHVEEKLELELEQELLPTTTTAKTTTTTKKQKKAKSEEHPVPPSPASRSCRQTLILRHPFTTSPAFGHGWRAALLADTHGFPTDSRFGPRPPQPQPPPPPPPLPASTNPFLSRV